MWEEGDVVLWRVSVYEAGAGAFPALCRGEEELMGVQMLCVLDAAKGGGGADGFLQRFDLAQGCW